MIGSKGVEQGRACAGSESGARRIWGEKRVRIEEDARQVPRSLGLRPLEMGMDRDRSVSEDF